MNDLSLEDFVDALRTDSAKSAGFKYLAPEVEVHHINGDELDDSPDNLEALPMSAHKQQHTTLHQNQLGTRRIVSITPLQEEVVYDVMMQAPFHNFIANGFVAHNCDMYGGCQFRDLCSRSPNQREAWARGAYKKRTWDPTIARGDI